MTQKMIGHEVPTVAVAINKSRLKVYNKDTEMPTYYLQKGQEFQLELFNPTNRTVLAKIHLNSQMISQGGLVIRPGERVFLDRYFDVAKKFKFDTYEVANTNEVKKAIENNGDIKVQFYNEVVPIPTPTYINPYYGNISYGSTYNGTLSIGNSSTGGGSFSTANGVCSTYTSSVDFGTSSLFDSAPTLDSMPQTRSRSFGNKLNASKSIETGRVEQGGESNQKFNTVSKTFEHLPFHVIEYKLLPISQKVNTTEDIKVKMYCTNCGAKVQATHKFCSTCGGKI